jgi:cytochrome P450
MAQAELDLIIGPDRLPSISDRARLPYVDALVKEVLRWAPIAPLGGYTVVFGIWVFWASIAYDIPCDSSSLHCDRQAFLIA